MNSSYVLLAESTSPLSATQVQSVLDFVLKGGPVMIVIGACSLIALAVIVERLIVLRRRNVIPPAFLAGLKAVGDDPVRALDFCTANASPAANVLAAAIKRRRPSPAAVEKA